MFAGKGRREVPDSEDEPMTSSPIDVLDGATDKLYETKRDPPQDAQEALQQATRHRQASQEYDASPSSDNADGWGADLENASIHCDASKVAHTDVQSDPSPEGHVVDTRLPKMTSRLVVNEAQAQSVNTTDDTAILHAPEPGTLNKQKSIGDQLDNSTYRPLSQLDTSGCSFDANPEASSSTNVEIRQPETAQLGTDNLTSNRATDCRKNEVYSGMSGAPQKVPLGSLSPHGESLEKDNALQVKGEVVVSQAALSDIEVAHKASKDVETQARAIESSNDSITVDAATIAPEKPLDTPGISGDQLSPVPAMASVSSPQISKTEAKPDSTEPTTGRLGKAMNEGIAYCDPTNKASFTARDDASPLTHMSQVLANTMSVSIPGSHTTQNIVEQSDNTPNSTDTNMISDGTKAVMNPLTSTAESISSLEPVLPSQTSTTSSDSVPLRTPQEITIAELKAQKAALIASLAALPAIQVLMEESASSNPEMSTGDDEPTESDIMTAANRIVKTHIKLLHEYNELKDIGQGLMGLIADQRGVRIVEIQDEFGIESKD